MPFVSEKQRRYLYSQKPEVARKFAKDSQPPKKKLKGVKAMISNRLGPN